MSRASKVELYQKYVLCHIKAELYQTYVLCHIKGIPMSFSHSWCKIWEFGLITFYLALGIAIGQVLFLVVIVSERG